MLFFSIFFLSYSIYQLIFNKYNNLEIEGIFKLKENYKNFLLFRKDNINFQIHKQKIKIDFSLLNNEINQVHNFYIKGKLVKLNNLSLFNFSNQIFFSLRITDLRFIDSEKSYSISNSMNPIVNQYLDLIVINKHSRNSLIYQKLNDLNILHLFTISGFHFNLIYLFFNSMFSKRKKLALITDLIGIALLIIYLVVLDFKISAARSMLFIMLIFLNKNMFDSKFDNITLLSLCAFLIAILNPYLIFSYSYILSFSITLIILTCVFLFRNFNFYWKTILILVIAHIYATLITHTFNENYNIFSFFIQILLIPIISFNYIFTLVFFKVTFLIEKTILLLDAFLNLLLESNLFIKFIIPSDLCILLSIPLFILRKVEYDNKYKKFYEFNSS
ncbi:competence protein ComEC [Metamycoplasma auris]|uniref:Competence protein ComEC n=1 Tax=Metamycoplasma auris TaxID=51363 RepID=A0A2W7GW14_9BACT|nr:ComEC/Rec2 family competence protein [Metamycoplasma auris]PZW01399.1 competence protein ComEC [Metamycoplasma auris]